MMITRPRRAALRLIPAGLLAVAGVAASPALATSAAPTAGQAPAAEATVDPPSGPVGFDAPEFPDDITQVARLAVVADVARVRPGETFHLAVSASMARHWHTYWINPGDTGVPVTLDVKAPEGFTVGTPRFPRPEVITSAAGTTYGYDAEAWIFIPVTAPRELSPDGGDLEFTVDAMYLVCREMCLIGNDTLRLSLPRGTGDAAIPAAERTMTAMRPWLARLPRPLRELENARMSVDLDAGRVSISIPVSAADGAPVLLPAPGPGVGFGEAAVRRDGDRWDIRIPLTLSPGNTLGNPFIIRGLIGLGDKPRDPSWHFEQTFPVPAAGG